MRGAVCNFLYTVSCLTLTRLCETGTIIIPLPQTRKLRDVCGGLPRSHRGPVVSGPVSALIITMLCRYLWSPLSPSPLSDPLPIKSRSPRSTLFGGTRTPPLTLASWTRCLSHGQWVWAPGLPSPRAVHSNLGHAGQSSQLGPVGSGVVSQNSVSSGHKYAFS